MRLCNYLRSSAAYRFSSALNLTGIEWEQVGVHLPKGEQLLAEYVSLNRVGQVPARVEDQKNVST